MIHGHSINAFLATLLDPEASEFKVTHIEMIKVCLPGGGSPLSAGERVPSRHHVQTNMQLCAQMHPGSILGSTSATLGLNTVTRAPESGLFTRRGPSPPVG